MPASVPVYVAHWPLSRAPPRAVLTSFCSTSFPSSTPTRPCPLIHDCRQRDSEIKMQTFREKRSDSLHLSSDNFVFKLICLTSSQASSQDSNNASESFLAASSDNNLTPLTLQTSPHVALSPGKSFSSGHQSLSCLELARPGDGDASRASYLTAGRDGVVKLREGEGKELKMWSTRMSSPSGGDDDAVGLTATGSWERG